jgi:hypothetical protein
VCYGCVARVERSVYLSWTERKGLVGLGALHGFQHAAQCSQGVVDGGG